MADELVELPERLPEESDRAYAAFVDYVLLGPGRSHLALVERYSQMENPPTKSANTINVWARRFRWDERVVEYDAKRHKAIANAIEEDREAAKKARIKALTKALKKLDDVIDVALQPEGMRPADVVNALRIIVQELRAEFGDEPVSKHLTAHIGIEVSKDDLDKLKPEKLSELCRTIAEEGEEE